MFLREFLENPGEICFESNEFSFEYLDPWDFCRSSFRVSPFSDSFGNFYWDCIRNFTISTGFLNELILGFTQEIISSRLLSDIDPDSRSEIPGNSFAVFFRSDYWTISKNLFFGILADIASSSYFWISC